MWIDHTRGRRRVPKPPTRIRAATRNILAFASIWVAYASKDQCKEFSLTLHGCCWKIVLNECCEGRSDRIGRDEDHQIVGDGSGDQ